MGSDSAVPGGGVHGRGEGGWAGRAFLIHMSDTALGSGGPFGDNICVVSRTYAVVTFRAHVVYTHIVPHHPRIAMSGSVGNQTTNILPRQDPMFVPPRGEDDVPEA